MVNSPSRTPGLLKLVRPPDDADFVRRCVNGERPALRELFERERGRLHALLFRMVGPSAHLDDLLQDAFLEVFRSIGSFRGESSLRTWIDRCAVRVAYAFFARKARVPVLETLSDAPDSDRNAEEHALLREATRRLYAELDRLVPHGLAEAPGLLVSARRQPDGHCDVAVHQPARRVLALAVTGEDDVLS